MVYTSGVERGRTLRKEGLNLWENKGKLCAKRASTFGRIREE